MNYEVLVDRETMVVEQPGMEFLELESRVLPVVDKDRKIILEKVTAENWLKLVAAARQNGYDFDIGNGFRTNEYQEKIFNYYIEKIGYEAAIKRVAMPGYSEHQTGLSIDFDYFREVEEDGIMVSKIVQELNEDDPEIKWIMANMADYGFILRYPKDKIEITGYNHEPWHIRYVGAELANYLTSNNLTLDEYHKNKKVY